MRPYLVVEKNRLLSRGESEFWADFRLLVPVGFRFTRAHNSPNALILEVERWSGIAVPKVGAIPDPEPVTIMTEWAKADIGQYRMEM